MAEGLLNKSMSRAIRGDCPCEANSLYDSEQIVLINYNIIHLLATVQIRETEIKFSLMN